MKSARKLKQATSDLSIVSKPQLAELIDLDAAKAVGRGECYDPFAVLGVHNTKHGNVVRVYDPGADAIDLAYKNGKSVSLTSVPDAPGVFVGLLEDQSEYRLIGRHSANSWEFVDPYAFPPVLGELDQHLMREGKHQRLWEALGANTITHADPVANKSVEGTHFAVWAPNVRQISVVGEFNGWNPKRHIMRCLGASGIWEIFLPGVKEGAVYKYRILDTNNNELPLKADPVGFGSEHPPKTGSVVRNLKKYIWQDDDWMKSRHERQNINTAISIYEVHLGSWRRITQDGDRPLSYVEAASELIDYVHDMGFTHIELMPISEFPFDGSWGYQPVGLFAPTIRFGPPDEFRNLVEAAHKKNIGIILDWVPGHFPSDAHGLEKFNGAALYEHQDPREGFHQDWNTLIFNYGRREVENYLIANALYWLEEYHIDGLRVDAVASMLYRDYSRKEGEWIPNKDGGRENFEAIDFLKHMNEAVYANHPGIITIAEESTSFPGVSRATDQGGLGFGFKWNMGWMHDTLEYISHDPIHRKHHHHNMTFGIQYAFSENFILPISHDEVVHGKGSMIEKMPGDNAWDKFANLRAYYSFMWTHPGKKLLFMGCEFAQGKEWNHDKSLDWHQLESAPHQGIQNLVRDLNAIYRENTALHVRDCDAEGFKWIDLNASEESIYVFARYGNEGDDIILVVCNMAPVERANWRVGFPNAGKWQQILNSDAARYGGSDRFQIEELATQPIRWHDQDQSGVFTLPSLSTLVFKFNGNG